MPTFSENILLALSKKNEDMTREAAIPEWTLTNSLDTLSRIYPDFKEIIKGKSVVDFGCGLGYQSVAMAQNGAGSVLGLDTNLKALEKAWGLAAQTNVKNRVTFQNNINEEDKGKFDLVISQNSMEHFPDPIFILNLMKSLIKPEGKILITFGPPWYAPYGSHMQFFTSVPWVNLLFNETTVMNVRSRFRQDGAKRYEEVESGLNKMSVGKFERIIQGCGMQLILKRYDCVKGINIFVDIPGLRELFINHISCVLIKKNKIS